MKSQKGVTLTALVIYVAVFSMVIAIMAMISAYFYKNVTNIKDSPRYISEFNKFAMFFVQDVKKNKTTSNVTSQSVEFADGTVYTYKNNAIYRNDVRITKHVKQCEFTSSTYTVAPVTKKIIHVDLVLGNTKNELTKSLDFVLKYW